MRAALIAVVALTLVDPAGEPTSYHLDYGTSTAYGSQTPARSTSALGPVSETIVGLGYGTVHYRLVATNASGVVLGMDRLIGRGEVDG
ncbi:MAG: hypothetical protein ACR2ND_11695 [Solirubrobacteraceae bacterium]